MSGHPLKIVVYIKLDEKISWVRWRAHEDVGDRGKRNDDSLEALKKRLEEFQNKTLPVLEFYREKHMLIELDGDMPTNKIFKILIQRLLERAQKPEPTKP